MPAMPPVITMNSSLRVRRAGHLEVIGQLTAAQVAEDERRAGSAGGRDRIDGIVDRAEGTADARHLEQDDGGGEGHQEAAAGLLPGDAAAVLADHPGDAEKGKDADRGLKILHGLRPSESPRSDCRHTGWLAE